jgi:hypothetical protein
LVAEHLGVDVDEVVKTANGCGSLLGAVEALRGEGRSLRPFSEETIAGEGGPLAENDLMDPDHVPRSLTRSVQRFLSGLRDEAR